MAPTEPAEKEPGLLEELLLEARENLAGIEKDLLSRLALKEVEDYEDEAGDPHRRAVFDAEVPLDPVLPEEQADKAFEPGVDLEV